MRIHRALAYIVVSACALDVLLVLLSWLVSSAFPESSVRSLLGSEGVRWFLGNLAGNVCNESLVWILFVGMAYGMASKSGIVDALSHLRKTVDEINFRERLAFVLSLTELVFVVLAMSLLTFVPHAVLLSVSGDLFPSSFSRSIVPVACLAIILVGTTFGFVTDNIRSAEVWFDALVYGLRRIAPLLLVYVLVVQLACTLRFVFCF